MLRHHRNIEKEITFFGKHRLGDRTSYTTPHRTKEWFLKTDELWKGENNLSKQSKDSAQSLVERNIGTCLFSAKDEGSPFYFHLRVEPHFESNILPEFANRVETEAINVRIKYSGSGYCFLVVGLVRY